MCRLPHTSRGIRRARVSAVARVLCSACPFTRRRAQLNRAYIQYLTPVGLTLRAGKFGTLLGAEVAQTVYNFNVTRGNVYNLLQFIDDEQPAGFTRKDQVVGGLELVYRF